jgi:hypothetical protein
MSILKGLQRAWKQVARPIAGKLIPGFAAVDTVVSGVSKATGVGRVLTQTLSQRINRTPTPRPSTMRATAMPGVGAAMASPVTSIRRIDNATLGASTMSILPSLGRQAGQVVRRYGGTAATVATAGAVLYDAAGNPVKRRKPKSKGITARELKSFTRVTSILNKYCKTPPPMKRRGATRSKSCR